MTELKIYDDTMREEIKGFFSKCFSALGWKYETDGRHADTVNIRTVYMCDGGCFWCLFDDGKLVGTVALRTVDKVKKTVELKRLYVLEETQGRGFGDLLFKTCIDYAKEQGFKRIYSDTRKDRFASQHLMRKYGFEEISKYNENPHAELYFMLDFQQGK